MEENPTRQLSMRERVGTVGRERLKEQNRQQPLDHLTSQDLKDFFDLLASRFQDPQARHEAALMHQPAFVDMPALTAFMEALDEVNCAMQCGKPSFSIHKEDAKERLLPRKPHLQTLLRNGWETLREAQEHSDDRVRRYGAIIEDMLHASMRTHIHTSRLAG
jgi:hypothetical protein